MKWICIVILNALPLISAADEPAVVQLIDGSRYVGKLASPTFELTTPHGTLRVPFEKLISIRIGERVSAIVTSDDDTISGKLTRKAVSLASSVGDLKIDLSKIAGIWPKERGMTIAGTGWGPARDGLRLRARCETKKVTIGKSFELVLELKNFGAKARKVDVPVVDDWISQWSRNRRTGSVFLKIKKLRPKVPQERALEAEEEAMEVTFLTLNPRDMLRVVITVSTVDGEVQPEEAQAEELEKIHRVKDLGGGVREVKLVTEWEVYGAGSYEIRPVYQRMRYGGSRHGPVKAPALNIEVTK